MSDTFNFFTVQHSGELLWIW